MNNFGLIKKGIYFIHSVIGLPTGPVRTKQNFVCFAKNSVNSKTFLVRTIFFFTVHNFPNCHQSSQTPSGRFRNLQFFVRRQSPFFFDSYPSSGHFISQTWSIKVTLISISGKTKNFACLWCEEGSKKIKKNWWVQNFQIFRRHQTLFFVVVRTGPKAVYYSTTDLFLILGKGGLPYLVYTAMCYWAWYSFVASLS